MARACLASGYKYLYEGKRNWRRSSFERWEVVMRKAICGREVGRKNIDGSDTVVVKAGGKFYAALPSHVKRR